MVTTSNSVATDWPQPDGRIIRRVELGGGQHAYIVYASRGGAELCRFDDLNSAQGWCRVQASDAEAPSPRPTDDDGVKKNFERTLITHRQKLVAAQTGLAKQSLSTQERSKWTRERDVQQEAIDSLEEKLADLSS